MKVYTDLPEREVRIYITDYHIIKVVIFSDNDIGVGIHQYNFKVDIDFVKSSIMLTDKSIRNANGFSDTMLKAYREAKSNFLIEVFNDI